MDFHRRIVVGTPVTPKRLLPHLEGFSFCVSFARPDQIEECIELVRGTNEILILDNGAFSIWKAGVEGRELPKRLQFADQAEYRKAFWHWANEIQRRCPEAVAVIPDVIGGSEEDNLIEISYALRYGRSAFPERCMSIWHTNESDEFLITQCRLLNFVGVGSCMEHDIQGKDTRPKYFERIREASKMIDMVEELHNRRPWIHLMRGLGQFHKLARFDSADSTNAAVNHHRYKESHGDLRSRFIAERTEGLVYEGVRQSSMELVRSCISNFDDAPSIRPVLEEENV